MSERLLQQYEVLYKKAAADIALAKCGFKANDSNIDSATLHFHLQQGVEKLLKSLLSFYNIHFEKTHDLKVLSRLCDDNKIELPAYIEELKALNPFAVFGRYELLDDESGDFEKNAVLVDKFVEYVKRVVSI